MKNKKRQTKTAARQRSSSDGAAKSVGVPTDTSTWGMSRRDLQIPLAVVQDIPVSPPESTPLSTRLDSPVDTSRDAAHTPSLASMLWDLGYALADGRLINLITTYPGQSAKFDEDRDPSSDGYYSWSVEKGQYQAMLRVAQQLPSLLANRPLAIPKVALVLQSDTSTEDVEALALLLEKDNAMAPVLRDAAITEAQGTQQLSLPDRLRLLADLRGGGTPLSDAAVAARDRILRDTPLDPEFERVDDPLRAQARVALVKEFSSVTREWPKMSEQERVAVLNNVLRSHCAQLKIQAPRIEFGARPVEVGDGERSPVQLGAFVESRMSIELNTGHAMWASFPEVVGVLVHENTHNYQRRLARELQAGRLDAADPRYLQVQLFAVNQGHGYAPPHGDALTYRNQPVERHAMQAGAEARRAFTDALKQEGKVLDTTAKAAAAANRPPAAMLGRLGAVLKGDDAAPIVAAMDLITRYLAAPNAVERFKLEIQNWLDARPGLTEAERAPVLALLGSNQRLAPLQQAFDAHSRGAEDAAHQRLIREVERKAGLAGQAHTAARSAAAAAAAAAEQARQAAQDLGQDAGDQAVQSAVAAAEAQARSAADSAANAERAAKRATELAGRHVSTSMEAAAIEKLATGASDEAQLFLEAAVAAAEAAQASANLVRWSVASVKATRAAAESARQAQAEATLSATLTPGGTGEDTI